MPHAVIDSYIEDYVIDQDYHRHAAEHCHNRIHDALAASGIRHISSFRAKRKERLEDKLYQRATHEGKNYQTRDDITNDIVDLAGVRIVLYFPGDMSEALRLVRALYQDIRDERTLPQDNQRRSANKYKYRFTGYVATHLQVILGTDGLPDNAKHYANARVEIQVASMFMHAWAEVEHDLIYKPLRGELSDDEYAWLDQINGLAIAGDLALEQLQRTMNARIAEQGRPFRNHYDLASFIHARAMRDGDASAEPKMGRADKLLAFLSKLDLDQPRRLEPYLDQLSPADPRPLVEQVVEKVIALSEGADERRSLWQAIDEARNLPSPYGDVPAVDDGQAATYAIENRLVQHWGSLDDAARRVVAARSHRDAPGIIDWLDAKLVKEFLGLDARTIDRLVASHQTFTRLRYGNWNGTKEELEQHADAVREVIRRIYSEYTDILDSERAGA